MEKLEEVIDQSINKFLEELSEKLDKSTLEDFKPKLEELVEKRKNRTLDLNDLKSLLLLYRNVIIPASMTNEANKLRAISGLVNGAVGIRKSS